MGSALNLFITVLCMSIILSVFLPTEETQFLEDNLFSQFLTSQTDPITGERVYMDNGTAALSPEWTQDVQQETGFFQAFIDGLGVIKRLINTLINIAVLPITIAIRLNVPDIVRILFFIPLAIIYSVAIMVTVIRGVQP